MNENLRHLDNVTKLGADFAKRIAAAETLVLDGSRESAGEILADMLARIRAVAESLQAPE